MAAFTVPLTALTLIACLVRLSVATSHCCQRPEESGKALAGWMAFCLLLVFIAGLYDGGVIGAYLATSLRWIDATKN